MQNVFSLLIDVLINSPGKNITYISIIGTILKHDRSVLHFQASLCFVNKITIALRETRDRCGRLGFMFPSWANIRTTLFTRDGYIHVRAAPDCRRVGQRVLRNGVTMKSDLIGSICSFTGH